MNPHVISRRRALGWMPAATLLAQSSQAARPRKSPNDRLNLAGIGVGGVGASYLEGCAGENVTALCDVDHACAAKTFAKYPDARRYRDYRVMFDREKDLDAVIIGTPDHSHARIALAAIDLGLAVYCAKPLTRTIAEARQLARAAAEKKVATQMSVQSCASDPACSTAEWIRAGAIGPVREVQVWSDRPVWPQGIARPAEAPAVPPELDWDLWLGQAPKRPYHPIYHPFSWRGWVDFGTGPIGDMGCHTFHVIFRALGLEYPTAVSATSSFQREPVYGPDADWSHSRRADTRETFPAASIITWDFPARGDLPPVRMHWYDGGLKPPRPAEFDAGKPLPADGILFHGDRGILFSGFSGGPRLLPAAQHAAYTPPAKTLERTRGHYAEWIAAAKGGPPTNCPFRFGSLLTEVTLLGTIAVRTGRPLVWDAAQARFPGDAQADEMVSR